MIQLPLPHLLLLLLFITTAKALTCDYCTLPVLNKPHPLHSLSFLQHTPPPPFPRAAASLLPYLRPHFLLHRPSFPSSCLLTILDSSTSPTIFTAVTALTMLLPPPDRRELTPALPSATQTETDPSVQTSICPVRIPDGTLRLRGGPVENRRVRWDADVIDNEGMGKKKSKGSFHCFATNHHTVVLFCMSKINTIIMGVLNIN